MPSALKKHSLWEHRQGPLCPPREPEAGSSEEGLLALDFEWELSQQRPGGWVLLDLREVQGSCLSDLGQLVTICARFFSPTKAGVSIQEIIPDSLKTVDTHLLISQVGNRVTDGACFWLNAIRVSPLKERMPA